MVHIDVAAIVDAKAGGQHLGQHAHAVERLEPVAVDEDARALEAPGVGLLDESDLRPTACQRDGSGAAGNAGAGDENVLNGGHASPLG